MTLRSFCSVVIVYPENVTFRVIQRSLDDGDGNNDRAAWPFLADVFHFHVDIAVVLVKLLHAVEVLLKLDFIQPAGFIKEGDHGFAARLHLLAQNLGAEVRVALELNAADRAL